MPSAQVPHRMSWWEAASETSSARFYHGRKREGENKRQTLSSLLAFLHLQVEDKRVEGRFAGEKKRTCSVLLVCCCLFAWKYWAPVAGKHFKRCFLGKLLPMRDSGFPKEWAVAALMINDTSLSTAKDN